MLKIQTLIDDAKCFETVRTLRWREGVSCVRCGSAAVTKQVRDSRQPERQKYRCRDCGRWLDDLTGTVFAGQPSSAVAHLGAVPLLHGHESVEPAYSDPS
ncbi:transposase [Halochromatium glycolicum]|uniref:transposase n=1 Tax=Halochromatium glycolicum TaxID=85075 RepID=UPI001F5B251A|nr:transposase [Halochromatium glycolicum]